MPPTRWLAVAFVAALAVTGCSGGKDDAASKKKTETSSAEFARASVDLDVSRAELVSPHEALGPLPQKTADDVRAVVEKLLLVTSAQPLVEGKAGGGFASLFTPDAGARAANHDRDVFFDERVGQLGALTQDDAHLGMTGLAGIADPKTQLVVAKFVWDVHHGTDVIERSGDLSLVPSKGAWKIGAYTIIVKRTIDGSTTTTTAASK